MNPRKSQNIMYELIWMHHTKVSQMDNNVSGVVSRICTRLRQTRPKLSLWQYKLKLDLAHINTRAQLSMQLGDEHESQSGIAWSNRCLEK